MPAPPVRFAPVLCARCAHNNPDDARFCSSCGAPLTPVGADEATTTLTLSAIEAADNEDELERYLDGLAPGVGLLVVRHGPDAGASYRLEAKETAIGRHPDSDVFLDDVTVSRRHVVIDHDDAGVRAARRGVAQRHVRQSQARRRSEARVRRRGADRPLPAQLRHRRRARKGRVIDGEARALLDRRRVEPAPRRVPRYHDLEDPFPREPGTRRSRAHTLGVSQVLSGGRRATALHTSPAARALLAAEGHQGAPRRDRQERWIRAASKQPPGSRIDCSTPRPSTRCSRRRAAPRNRPRPARPARLCTTTRAPTISPRPKPE